MRAMQLRSPRSLLEMADLDLPRAAAGQLLVKVRACGVCRTDLHVVDGDLPNAKSPIVPGHEVVGTIAEIGTGVAGFKEGDRVGIPWLGFTCGKCRYCRSGRENLCDAARFTGYDIDGGYADYTVADSRYCFLLPAPYSDLEAAPLLCAGLIGYRALRMAGEAERLVTWLWRARIVAQVARHQGAWCSPPVLATPGAAVCANSAPHGPGTAIRPPPSRSTRRCSPGRCSGSRSLEEYGKGRHGRVPASHIIRLSRHPVGRAPCLLGRQPDPRRRPEFLTLAQDPSARR